MEQLSQVRLKNGARPAVTLRVGDDQTKYEGDRCVGAPVEVDGVAMAVRNWGPDYLSFCSADGAGVSVKYTQPAWSAQNGMPWGTITQILRRPASRGRELVGGAQ